MTQFDEKVSNVVVHRQATSAVAMFFRILPLQVDTCKLFAFPVLGDVMVLLEYLGKMVSVLFADVLHTEIIYDEGELDGASCVLPKAGSCCGFVVPCLFEASAEEVVSKFPRLFQTIAATDDFKINPSMSL